MEQTSMAEAQPLHDASHLYEVERRVYYAERPGFRIGELQLSPTQKVPWHFHNHIDDTFYVLDGHVRLFLREPQEEVELGPGESYCVKARRPHLVTNGGPTSTTFFILQGVGEYDYVPLV
jgi:quercetin dioxygenase-like cupin family protein